MYNILFSEKCVLVEAWSPECEYRNTRNPNDYCYTKMYAGVCDLSLS